MDVQMLKMDTSDNEIVHAVVLQKFTHHCFIEVISPPICQFVCIFMSNNKI
uniref:Uncharacterized protein n=1 Tax=Arion vulgaris TaxID=1028688 RepID=A0A0B6YNM1_9EUPU